MSAPKSFPLFPRLPTEIRFMVWECFALSKAPTLHICHHWSNYEGYSKSIERGYVRQISPRPFEFMHFTTARSLMQVNREARYRILKTLQLWRLPTYGGTGTPDETKVLFIDWEKDVLWYPPPPPFAPPQPLLYQAILKRHIKNIAFDLSLSPHFLELPVTWGLWIYHLYASALLNFFTDCRFLGPDLELLRCVLLVVSWEDLLRIYRKDHPEASGILEPFTSKFEFGFIPILAGEINQLLENDPNRYSIADEWRRTTLQIWLDKFMEKASRSISLICERKIDVRIVIDAHIHPGI
ncbi:hypothetical protein F5Y13DRAFT_202575 [Hypoxylon sp. FL1857]|nr:hypothetical protein F5Y13DRAFT_202575 [Hypoxylon sp. FL1857]